MGLNSDLLESRIFFSKTVGAKTHVFVEAKTCKLGGTKHVPPIMLHTSLYLQSKYVVREQIEICKLKGKY